MPRPAITVLCLVAAVGLASAAAGADADADAAARGVADAFRRAVAAGDAEAVVALYADDARLVWPGRGQEARGREAIAALVRRELPALRASSPKLVSLDATAVADGVVAVVGRWEQGEPGRRVEVRTTELLVRRDGAWRYLVDHASVGAGPPPPARGREERRRRRPPRD